MPRARKQHAPQPAPAAAPFIDPATLPERYAMRVAGDCMAPEIEPNALLLFDRTEPVAVGDTVIVFLRPELVPAGGFQAQIKRLAMAIPPWVKFPYRAHPESNVQSLLVLEALNPRRTFGIRCADVLALHKCIGLPEESTLSANTVAAAWPSPPETEAALLALRSEYEAATAAVAAMGDVSDDEAAPIMARMEVVLRAIYGASPRTLAGLAFKAEALNREARLSFDYPMGRDVFEHGLWSLTADVLAVIGEKRT